MRELLRTYERQLERKDEMIQTLLDRIQHPERTPVWREPVFTPEEPLEPYTSYMYAVPDPDQMP